jgi:hypothetical protein
MYEKNDIKSATSRNYNTSKNLDTKQGRGSLSKFTGGRGLFKGSLPSEEMKPTVFNASKEHDSINKGVAQRMDKYQISQDGKGICGFTHMVQMLIDNGKLTLDGFNQTFKTSTAFADEWFRVQIAHDRALAQEKNMNVSATALNQSLKFTGGFGDKYSDITLQELLDATSWNWAKRPGFALTPEAVCDYVLRQYGMNMMIQPYHPNKSINQLWTSKTNNLGPGMYGIKKTPGAGPNGDEIQHYVYIDKEGELMTWQKNGQDAMDALKQAGFTEAVVRLYPK